MIRNILKGFIIGIGKIMPGVSGSMLAISLNVYERLLGIIADIRNITADGFKFLFAILFGAMLSITVFSRGVKWLLDSFYFPIMLLFIGLIIGGLPEIFNEIRRGKGIVLNVIIFIVSLTLSYVLASLGTLVTIGNGNVFVYFVLGLIEAFSSIVPGISGTAIYMSLGVYDMLLDFFGNIFNPYYYKFAVFFGIGILVGVIILAKTITYLLRRKKVQTYFAILGFMTSSIIIMLREAFKDTLFDSFDGFMILEFMCGVFFFYLGYKLTIKINYWLAKS